MASLIASFLGTGWILGRVRGSDAGSGTVGAAFAALVAIWAGRTGGWPWVLAGAVGLLAAGLWSTRQIVGEVGDAGWIVIDEATGAFIALIGVTLLPAAIAAFVVFRLADIAKRLFRGWPLPRI